LKQATRLARLNHTALQKRVAKLEQRNDTLAAAALRLAHSNAEEFREQEQRPAEMSAP